MATPRAKNKTKPDLGAALHAAALPERTVELCLRGDLVAEMEDLERGLRDVRTNTQTMADQGRARSLAEKIEALRTDMQDASFVFRFRGLPRKEWLDLHALHPPREGNEDDKTVGYNNDTFWPALIRATLIDPAVDDAQWERLDAVLTSSQFDELAQAALTVCRRRVDVPFSFAASATLRSSSETSA